MTSTNCQRVIVFTGAGSGIGLAAVTSLLSTQLSACIVAVDINGKKLDSLRPKYHDRLEVVVGDVSKRQTSQLAVDGAIRRFGHLDALVLNAAILKPVGPVATADVDEWKHLYDINFFSLVHSIQIALPYLRESKGSLIMTSSGVAIRSHPNWIAYASSKRAMNCLCAGLVLEEPLITVICVTPGIVDTGLQKEVREQHKGNLPDDMYNWMNDLYKNGELLKPEQPGGTLAKLAMNGVPKDLSGELLPWDDERIV